MGKEKHQRLNVRANKVCLDLNFSASLHKVIETSFLLQAFIGERVLKDHLLVSAFMEFCCERSRGFKSGLPRDSSARAHREKGSRLQVVSSNWKIPSANKPRNWGFIGTLESVSEAFLIAVIWSRLQK